MKSLAVRADQLGHKNWRIKLNNQAAISMIELRQLRHALGYPLTQNGGLPGMSGESVRSIK